MRIPPPPMPGTTPSVSVASPAVSSSSDSSSVPMAAASSAPMSASTFCSTSGDGCIARESAISNTSPLVGVASSSPPPPPSGGGRSDADERAVAVASISAASASPISSDSIAEGCCSGGEPAATGRKVATGATTAGLPGAANGSDVGSAPR